MSDRCRFGTRLAKILVDDIKNLTPDVVGGHLLDDLTMGHDVKPIADLRRYINALLHQQQRSVPAAKLKQSLDHDTDRDGRERD